MKHTVHKLFFAWNFEKEEKWLNDMSAKGLQLVSVSLGKYVFEEGNKGEYQYKLELLENLPSHHESRDYIHFLEETGIEHVCSLIRWVYLRKKADGKPFEIYSDPDSKIKHYNRIRTIFFAVLPINIWGHFYYLKQFIQVQDTTTFIVCMITGLVVCLLLYGVFNTTFKIKHVKKDKLFKG